MELAGRSRFSDALLRYSDIPLRLMLFATFVTHGYLKLYTGVDGTANMLGSLHVPAPEFMAWVVTLVEFIGSFFILAGFLTRLAALALAVDMLFAILLVHAPQGFVMKAVPGGAPAGYEWPLALLAIGLCLLLRGAGPLSVDYLLRRKRRRERAERQAAKSAAAAPQPSRAARTGSATASSAISPSPAAQTEPAREIPEAEKPRTPPPAR